MSETILSIRGLQYATGVEALKAVNLDIKRGEIFALLGPNGAGKTTMISIICGIVNATAGEVLIDGKNIALAAPTLSSSLASASRSLSFGPLARPSRSRIEPMSSA